MVHKCNCGDFGFNIYDSTTINVKMDGGLFGGMRTSDIIAGGIFGLLNRGVSGFMAGWAMKNIGTTNYAPTGGSIFGFGGGGYYGGGSGFAIDNTYSTIGAIPASGAGAPKKNADGTLTYTLPNGTTFTVNPDGTPVKPAATTDPAATTTANPAATTDPAATTASSGSGTTGNITYANGVSPSDISEEKIPTSDKPAINKTQFNDLLKSNDASATATNTVAKTKEDIHGSVSIGATKGGTQGTKAQEVDETTGFLNSFTIADPQHGGDNGSKWVFELVGVNNGHPLYRAKNTTKETTNGADDRSGQSTMGSGVTFNNENIYVIDSIDTKKKQIIMHTESGKVTAHLS